MGVLVDEVDGAGEFFGQEGCGKEDCHDDDGERGHEARLASKTSVQCVLS